MSYWFLPMSGKVSQSLPGHAPDPAQTAKEKAEQRANYARNKRHPEVCWPRLSVDGAWLIIESDTKPETDAEGPYTAAEARARIESDPAAWTHAEGTF